MRVRMIRPAYWTDADLHTRLTADAREFYIGLWMEADDAGFIAWDLDRIGADLYPYRPLGWRRTRLSRWMEALAVNGHVRALDCGKHAVIPNLPKYQHCPKPAYPHQTAHRSCVSHMAPRGATGDPVVPAQEGKGIEGNRREEVARGANGASTEETTEFVARFVAVGGVKP
jgi:hypothetical protein